MNFLLLVTWIVKGQPPTHYQVPFTSLNTCEAARVKVITDAQRVLEDKLKQLQQSGGAQQLIQMEMQAAILNAPSASAVCVPHE
jgi:hypothetical protein